MTKMSRKMHTAENLFVFHHVILLCDDIYPSFDFSRRISETQIISHKTNVNASNARVNSYYSNMNIICVLYQPSDSDPNFISAMKNVHI